MTEMINSMRPRVYIKRILKNLLPYGIVGQYSHIKNGTNKRNKVPFNTANPEVSVSGYLDNLSDRELLDLVRDDGSVYFGQSAEDGVLSRIFKGKTDGFYVDIGAYNPTRYSNTKIFHRFLNWKGINIDANIDAIDMFSLERPCDININMAVGRQKGMQEMAIYKSAAINTLSKKNMNRQKSKGHKILETRNVPVSPLSEILKEYLPKNTHIDLLDIDIEGHDLEALRTNNWKLYRPSVILIEDYTINTKGFDSSDIYKFMVNKDYRFFSHAFDTSIYVNNQEFINEN